MAALHTEAKEAFQAWVAAEPRQGPAVDYKKLTNARYKYAMYIFLYMSK